MGRSELRVDGVVAAASTGGVASAGENHRLAGVARRRLGPSGPPVTPAAERVATRRCTAVGVPAECISAEFIPAELLATKRISARLRAAVLRVVGFARVRRTTKAQRGAHQIVGRQVVRSDRRAAELEPLHRSTAAIDGGDPPSLRRRCGLAVARARAGHAAGITPPSGEARAASAHPWQPATATGSSASPGRACSGTVGRR